MDPGGSAKRKIYMVYIVSLIYIYFRINVQKDIYYT